MLRFLADGSFKEETATPKMLGLGPRDVSLFVATSKASSTQRATVTPREGCILIRTEMVRAIIRQHEAIIFPSRYMQSQLIACYLYPKCAAPAAHLLVLWHEPQTVPLTSCQVQHACFVISFTLLSNRLETCRRRKDTERIAQSVTAAIRLGTPDRGASRLIAHSAESSHGLPESQGPQHSQPGQQVTETSMQVTEQHGSSKPGGARHTQSLLSFSMAWETTEMQP